MTEPSQRQEQEQAEGTALPISASQVEQTPHTVETVRLDDEEQNLGQVSEAKERAIVFGMYADTWSRIAMVFVMAAIFIGLNWCVVGFLQNAFAADIRMLESKPPTLTAADRLVTPNVLMSLLGATVIQVGASIAAIVSYLFPKNNGGSD
jgi:hypothetical protein